MIPEGGRTSYLGDVLAVVVAINKSIAVRATELVHVEYEVHQPKTDPIRVVTDSEDAVWGLEGNVLSTSTYQRGDVDIALENSAHVVTETFQTQRVEHAFLNLNQHWLSQPIRDYTSTPGDKESGTIATT